MYLMDIIFVEYTAFYHLFHCLTLYLKSNILIFWQLNKYVKWAITRVAQFIS